MAEKYAIVEFVDEGLVEAVPRGWLSPRKSSCKWPVMMAGQKMDRALKGDYNFNEGKWLMTKIRLLGTADSYSQAKKKLKKSEETSHIESSEEEKKKRRKRKKITTNEQESSDSEIEARQASQKEKIPPFPEMTNGGQQPKSGLFLEAENSKNLLSPKKANIQEDDETALQKKLISIMEGVKYDIRMLNKKFDLNLELLRDMKDKDNEGSETLPNAIAFSFPLVNVEELTELETRLSDHATAARLITVLSRVGGSTQKELTYNIMGKILTKDMAMQYSFHGRKQKLIFKDLKISNLIIEAVLHRHEQATEVEIQRRIGTFLSNSIDRMGGRKERRKM